MRPRPDHLSIIWFAQSPDAGALECLCSACWVLIGAEELPVRLWQRTADGGAVEARFCERCVAYYGMAVLAGAAGETAPE